MQSTDPLNVKRTNSGTVPITVVESDVTFNLKAGDVTDDGIGLSIEWSVGGVGVTGSIAQQYWSSGAWRTARTVAVTDGIGQVSVTPSRTMVYRIRAIAAVTPEGVDVTHPMGTSNECQVELT